MSVELISLLSSIFSLVGACILFYLALRVSFLLREAWKIKQNPLETAGNSEGDFDLDKMLFDLFTKKADSWSPTLHAWLVVGIVLTVIGGLLSLWQAVCNFMGN